MSTATADSIYRVLADCNRTVSPFSDHHEPFTVEIPNCRAFDRPGTTEVIHDVTAMGFSGVFALPGLWRDVGRLPGCTRWEAAGRPGHHRDVRQARHPQGDEKDVGSASRWRTITEQPQLLPGPIPRCLERLRRRFAGQPDADEPPVAAPPSPWHCPGTSTGALVALG